MRVEVVYALEARQWIESLELPDSATVADALTAVAGTPPFSGLDLTAVPVGIYGERVPRDRPLRGGDRVEIYRPLITDAREARRRRAGNG